MIRTFSLIGLVAVGFAAAPNRATATSGVYSGESVRMTLSFDHLVEAGDGNKQLANGATGEAQMTVDVVEMVSASRAKFVFRNAGPNASSITDVYFEDGALLGIADVDDSHEGVEFEIGATPSELPGGNNADPPFITTTDPQYFFSADSDKPTTPQGVNPGEWVGVIFDLKTGKTFQDVLTSLVNYNRELYPGESLRIGIKVQGFENGGSEGFVNNPPSGGGGGGGSVVPEPSSFALLSIASLSMMSYGFVRRRKPEDESQPQG